MPIGFKNRKKNLHLPATSRKSAIFNRSGGIITTMNKKSARPEAAYR